MSEVQRKLEIINHNEGWIDIYIDGKHVYGGHDITPEMFLEALGIPHESRWISDEEAKALADQYPHLGER